MKRFLLNLPALFFLAAVCAAIAYVPAAIVLPAWLAYDVAEVVIGLVVLAGFAGLGLLAVGQTGSIAGRALHVVTRPSSLVADGLDRYMRAVVLLATGPALGRRPLAQSAFLSFVVFAFGLASTVILPAALAYFLMIAHMVALLVAVRTK
jgi:hypothetical protein